MSDNHGTVSMLVRDDSGEVQVTTTVIVDDTVVSETSEVYVDVVHPELEESIDDCE